jgi:hypothetical protein
MNMKVLILFMVLLTEIVQAIEVKISVLEKDTQVTTSYSFDVASSNLKPLDSASGDAVPQTTTYSVKDGQLLAGDKNLAEADELLYQCHIDGCDLVIVRDEYNSFSNPLRILSAFAGHPIQVSKIVILKIVDGKVRKQLEIIRKPSSYDWTASVLE